MIWNRVLKKRLLLVGLLLCMLLTSSTLLNSSASKGEEPSTLDVRADLLFTGEAGSDGQVVAVLHLPAQLVPAKKSYSAVVPIILAGSFTLLGTGIGLLFNLIANKSARKYEWSRHVWDSFKDTYLELNRTLSATSDRVILRKKIEDVMGKILLPKSLEDSLNAIMTSQEEELRSAAQREAIIKLRQMISKPWEVH